MGCGMALLLYGITNPEANLLPGPGVCGSVVQSREAFGLRIYCSEVADPEGCLGTPESLKKAALQFHEVLRNILATATPIPFPFPTLLESVDKLEEYLASQQEHCRAALAALGNAVQYELVASWAADEQADLATPISGREYLKRRQETAGRTASVDNKLKAVTAGMVRDWRARQERRNHRWFALVARDERDRFIAALKSAAPSQGVRLRLSGPWPPSEFVAPRGEDGQP